MTNQKHLNITEHLSISKINLCKDALSLFADMRDSSKKPILKIILDATHSGRLTNNRVYPGKYMKDAVKTWMEPYAKPVLKHHNDEQDPIGRLASAEYIQLKYGYEFEHDYDQPKDDMGSGFCRLTANITDADAIEKLLDGRLKSVSTAQKSPNAFCSICGEDMLSSDSECEHWPGKTYKIRSKDKEDSAKDYLCYMITGPLKYGEVSFVNKPADSYAEVAAMNLDRQVPNSIDSYDKLDIDVGVLFLSDGVTEIPLIGNSVITAKDREIITGKTIVAVSPKFKNDKLSLANEEKIMTTETVTKTTDTSAASAGDSVSPQATKDLKTKEGVVAPEVKDKGTKEEDKSTVIDDATKATAIEAMASQLEQSKAVAKEATDKVARLETTLKEKDSELENLRKDQVKVMTELKMSYANSLLDAQLLLKKPAVSSIKDQESYDAKLKEYSERTPESLKDSVKDLLIELSDLRKGLGIKSAKDMASDEKVDSPVANASALKSETSEESNDSIENYFDKNLQ